MTPRYVLYYAPDNASLIIRLTLEEMALPYDTRLVDRSVSAQSAPDYLALNPVGQIPTLLTPDGPISETAAILLWLADQHGQMAPQVGTPDRGAVLKWLFFASNTLQSGLRILFYPEKYAGADITLQTALSTRMQQSLRAHLTLLDQLAAEGHAWFAGPSASILDYHIACCLRWCALYPEQNPDWFRLGDFSALQSLVAGLETRPAVVAAQQAEGLGPTPFTSPHPCNPPEGSAL